MMEIIGILTGGTIVAGFIVWATKLIITKAIDTGAKVYENKLDKELEIHKKNLDMMKIQYQIQYSSLHEKRGQVIAELYSLLYDLEQDLLYYTDIFQGPEWVTDPERDKKAATTFINTKTLFEKNRIYFDSELCNKLDKIIEDRFSIIAKMREARITANSISEYKIKVDKNPALIWVEQNKKVQGEITQSRKQLADEFRTLFGIEVSSQGKENN